MDLIRTISKSNRRLLIMTIRPSGEKRFDVFVFLFSVLADSASSVADFGENSFVFIEHNNKKRSKVS